MKKLLPVFIIYVLVCFIMLLKFDISFNQIGDWSAVAAIVSAEMFIVYWIVMKILGMLQWCLDKTTPKAEIETK